MNKDEALDLALETLESIQAVYPCETVGKRITAIKQARALDKKAENARELGLDYEPVGEAYLCDKCQTPFDGAWECPNCGHRSATKEPVYTTPPAAPVPLTYEQITAISKQVAEGGPEDSIDRFVRAIEAHHGITKGQL